MGTVGGPGGSPVSLDPTDQSCLMNQTKTTIRAPTTAVCDIPNWKGNKELVFCADVILNSRLGGTKSSPIN